MTDSPDGKLPMIMSVRLDPADIKKLREMADMSGKTMSAWLSDELAGVCNRFRVVDGGKS